MWKKTSLILGMAARDNLLRINAWSKHPFRMSSMNEQAVYVVDGGSIYSIDGKLSILPI